MESASTPPNLLSWTCKPSIIKRVPVPLQLVRRCAHVLQQKQIAWMIQNRGGGSIRQICGSERNANSSIMPNPTQSLSQSSAIAFTAIGSCNEIVTAGAGVIG